MYDNGLLYTSELYENSSLTYTINENLRESDSLFIGLLSQMLSYEKGLK